MIRLFYPATSGFFAFELAVLVPKTFPCLQKQLILVESSGKCWKLSHSEIRQRCGHLSVPSTKTKQRFIHSGLFSLVIVGLI